MLYLIGLGLDENSYNKKTEKIILNADKIYVEGYTVDYPYEIKNLQKQFKNKNFIFSEREFIESMDFLEESKKKNIVILIYGDPLIATTHITLVLEAKKRKIPFQIIHNSSIIDAISETGLQIYKFGKISSMPEWKKNYFPDSFMEIIKENKKINAHSLILIDINLDLKKSIKQLENSFKKNKIVLDKIILCQALGTKNQKILYKKIDYFKKLKKEIKPYCIIIPAKLHFIEKEFIESFE